MRPTRFLAICAALLVTEFLVGCELIADFDRTRIPVAKSDASTPAPASGSKDSGSSDEDAGTDATSTDAH